jgi:hypothetical protein
MKLIEIYLNYMPAAEPAEEILARQQERGIN